MPTRSRPLRCEVLEDRLTPSAGDLDPTFGTGGKSVLTMPPSFGQGGSALTADQHILIAGSSTNQFEVVRLTQAGVLDTAFGTNGEAGVSFSDFGANTLSRPPAVLVQPDGKILLVGTVAAGPNGPEKSVLGLARLNADGSPDKTFGDGGKVTVGFNLGTFADFESLNAAVLQPDGRIVAAGGVMATSPTGPGGAAVTTSELLVVRFTPDGQLDATFGSDGMQTAAFTPTSNEHAEANAVALMPDGRIVAAGGADTTGAGTQNPVAIRLTPGGRFDPTFDADGKAVVKLAIGGQAAAKTLALQSDGSVLLAGPSLGGGGAIPRAFVTRLTPTGQPDFTFARTGDVPFAFPFDANIPLTREGQIVNVVPVEFVGSGVDALLPQAGGRIIVVGEQKTSNTAGYDQYVTRLNPDGSVDTTFADKGVQHVAFDLGGTNDDFATSALRQANGNIVVVGSATDGTVGGKATAFRLLDDLPPLTASTILAGGPADGTTQALPGGASGLQLGAITTPFPGFNGSVRTAVADVNGDGVPDSIVAAGPGGGPNVIVYDGTNGAKIADFFAFESSFTGGVFVAAADLNGDGKAEVVVTPDQGGGPVVAVYDGAKLAAGQDEAAQVSRFLGIDDPAFRGGARAALGDASGDSTPDLLVSAGFLGGPRVALYDGRTIAGSTPAKLVPDFFAFEDSLRNGAFVAAGDLTGDGRADLAFGGGPGGAPRVRAFDGAKLLAAGSFTSLDDIAGSAQVGDFFAGDSSLRGGVRLAVRDADGDGNADLITGSGEGEPAQVRVYKGSTLTASATPTADQTLDPFGGATLADGVFVG